ncbi:MAG: YbbR-like domain-containing protein [Bacteriovoracaceae bacterium]
MVLKRTTNSRFLLKILSVFISLLLWVYVSNSEHISIDKNIELEILYPSNVSLTNETPKEIVYSLKGPRAIVRLILDREEKLTIDLRNQKVDAHHRHFFNFKSSDIDLPIGVQVLKILPQNIELTFDEKMKKSLPLTLQTVGSINSRYRLVQTKLLPTHVEVYGPKKELANLKELGVGPVDLSALRGSGKRSLPVLGLSDRIGLTSDTLPELIYEVLPLRSNMVLKHIPINLLSKLKIKKVSATEAEVFLYQEEANAEKVTKSDLKIEAILPTTPGEHIIKLNVKVSDKAEVFKVQPETIKVTLE